MIEHVRNYRLVERAFQLLLIHNGTVALCKLQRSTRRRNSSVQPSL